MANLAAIIITALFMLGCGDLKKKPEPEPEPQSKAEQLKATWENKLTAMTWADWPSETDCDGALWAGIAAAGGVTVDLSRAYDDNWQPFRRPTHDCYKEYKEKGEGFGSKATSSNDMILGLLWGAWVGDKFANIKHFMKYAQDNDYIFGSAEVEVFTRVVMSGNMRVFYSKAMNQITGGEFTNIWYDKTPVYTDTDKEWQAHLYAMGMLLYWDFYNYGRGSVMRAVNNPLPQAWPDLISNWVDKWPHNALFRAVGGLYSGDMSESIDMLLDDSRPCPAYARGDQAQRFCEAEWFFTARRVLDYLGK